MTAGPLAGTRVVELAGIGPGPFACMLLADMGADVIRVDRSTDVQPHPDGPNPDVVLRGRRSIGLDLKHPEGRQALLDLVSGADVLVEGFRPGVTERLGIGPAECEAVNQRLVYARITGWGQDGPLATTAGHDINYIAITGALDGSRRAGQRPVPPMNLLGDFGGGALYLAFGIACALFEARASGLGQVVDASIVDGTASLTNFIIGMRAVGAWPNPPGQNLLDTGAPFYDTYTCADGKELAVGALEPKFYAELVRLSGVDAAGGAEISTDGRSQPENWPVAKQTWATLFATRTRDEWVAIFEGSDACVAPVLSLDEAPQHPHLAGRGTYVERDGVVQAVPAPRFSRTEPKIERSPAYPGEHTDELLRVLGRSAEEIAALRSAGAVA